MAHGAGAGWHPCTFWFSRPAESVNVQGMSSEANPPLPKRLGSIDVYRGFVMFLMMGELFRFCAVASNLRAAGRPSGFWGCDEGRCLCRLLTAAAFRTSEFA